MKVITLCGSTKFKNEYHKINRKLTLEGNVVISVGVFGYEEEDEIRELLQKIHRKKIDMADEIFVINVDGFISVHTQQEIDYAKKIGKPIKYLVS